MQPEEKKIQSEEKDIGWDTSIFKQEKPSTAGKTFYGGSRRGNIKNESVSEVEP